MKKLLLTLTLIVVMTLGGCVTAPPTDYSKDFKDLEDKITLLESELVELELVQENMQSYLNRMVWVGYLLDEETELDAMQGMYMSLDGFEALSDTEKDLVDVTKFPSYIWDLNGDYVDLDTMCSLLTMKYLGMYSDCQGTFQLRIKLDNTGEFTSEEYIVRLSMMLIELSEYDFYTIDYPQIQVELIAGGTKRLELQSSLFNTPKYENALHPSIIWDEMFEIEVIGFPYDETQLDAIYQLFIDEATFEGYVLPNFN